MKATLFKLTSFLFISFSVYILFSTFISFRYQYLINIDIRNKTKTLSEDDVDRIPSIPNVGVTTLPISSLKAPYIIKSNQNRAYNLLKNGSNENPYIYYSEYILAT